MGNPEKPHEAGREKQGANDNNDRIAKLAADIEELKKQGKKTSAANEKLLAANEKLLRELQDKETEKRKDDWEKMGDRAPDDSIKRLIEEIGNNPNYFNSEETLRDAALRLAKEISRASSGISMGRDYRIISKEDKFDWGKLIGDSAILKKAFSQDTLDTAKALAEIDRRTSVYGEKSRMRKYAERFGDLIRQAKDPSVRDSYLKKFLKLHAAVWEDKDAIAYLQGMADSIDDPAVKAAAKTAQAAIEHAPKMNDEYRRRLVLNFVDDVSKILGAAAPAAPAAKGLPLVSFRPGRESLPKAEAEAGEGVGSSEAEAPALAAGPEVSSESTPHFTPAFFPAEGKKEKAPVRPRMTDKKRIELMEKSGTDIAKLKANLGLPANATAKQLVEKVRGQQKELWKALADSSFGVDKKFTQKYPKFASEEKFADGIWGPVTEDALKTVAANLPYPNENLTKLFAAFGYKTGEKQKVASAEKPAPAVPETPELTGARFLEKVIKPLIGQEIPLAKAATLKLSDGINYELKKGDKVIVKNIEPIDRKIICTPARNANTNFTGSIPARYIDFDSKEVTARIESYYKTNKDELASLEARWKREDDAKATGRAQQVDDKEKPSAAAA